MASRETTGFVQRGEELELAASVHHYFWRVCVGAIAAAALLASLSMPLAEIFRLGSPYGVLLAAVCVALYAPSHFLSGVLQGAERFRPFAFETAVEATAKVLFAVVLLGIAWRYPAAGVLAITLSVAVGLAINVRLVRQYLPRPTFFAATPRKVSLSYSVATLGTLGLLALLLTADTLVGKHYLPLRLAGLYAGVSLTGKIVFFATSALAIVVFPIFSRHHESGKRGTRSLSVTIATAIVIVLATVAVLAMEPRLVVSALLGARYLPIAGDVAWMGATFGLYAIAYLLATYLLARRHLGVLWALGAAVAVQLSGFYLVHSTIPEMIGVDACTFGVAIVGCLTVAVIGRFRRRPGARSRLHGDTTTEGVSDAPAAGA